MAWHDRAVTGQIDVLLLLALPASGKSEIRRYLDHLDPRELRGDMALGPTVQLDDYPYVHMMRRISEELAAIGRKPPYFAHGDAPWKEPLDWITLIHLLNEDFESATSGGRTQQTPSEMLVRFDRARDVAGAPPVFEDMTGRDRALLERGIAPDVATLDPIVPAATDATIVIEFARGGPRAAALPLPHPLGYAASIAALSDEIRARASILYVWVEPAESRRRNRERAVPGEDASILHHGVPEAVMATDYGTDDMGWLASQARSAGTIPIGDMDIPMQSFDNRKDRTSFLRAEPADWAPAALENLHHDLSAALLRLAAGV